MKQLSVILLIILICAVALRDMAILINWKIQQTELTTNYCINLDQPALTCHAKCYLEQQLTASNAPDDAAQQLTQLDELQLQFLIPTLRHASLSLPAVATITPDSRPYIYGSPHLAAVFHPPQTT